MGFCNCSLGFILLDWNRFLLVSNGVPFMEIFFVCLFVHPFIFLNEVQFLIMSKTCFVLQVTHVDFKKAKEKVMFKKKEGVPEGLYM